MTLDFYHDRIRLAEELIRDAGRLAKQHSQELENLQIAQKGAQDIVTDADRGIEAMIRERVHAAFPADAFLGEEEGAEAFDEESSVWIVDPIDGTQPFVSGLSEWCISIAFVQAMSLQFGLVFAPARDELFIGGRHSPASLNGRPVSPHPGTDLSAGITGVGHSPRVDVGVFLPVIEGVLRQGGMFYRSGSGALSLCDVAAGRLLGYVEAHINSWDCLGAVAVLRASGHQTNDLTGSIEQILTGGPIAVGANQAIYDRLSTLVSAGPAVDEWKMTPT